MKTIQIGNRKIGEGQPVFIIAEAGINHDGKLDQALKLIDVAKDAGCDAVKFQLFKAKDMYVQTPGEYKIASGEMRSIYELVKDAELPESWIPGLMEYCKRKDIIFMCSPFDERSVDILEENKIGSFKIASYALTHLPMIKRIARKNKPVFVSTAGAYLAEIEQAYRTLKENGNGGIVIMHCVAKYPSPLEHSNMNIITTLISAFPDVVVGFSDHSEDPVKAPAAAVALGAKVVEKHFTIDKSLPGADHSFALNPGELGAMVKGIREMERKLRNGEKIQIDPAIGGTSQRTLFPHEKYVREFAYTNIAATRDIAKGELLTKENIAVLRPGEKSRGLDPQYYEMIISEKVRAVRNIKRDNGISWRDILNIKDETDD